MNGFCIHSLAEGWAGSMWSLILAGPTLPLEPQRFPTALSPAQQGSAPYALQHTLLKNETTSSFSEENICWGKKKKIKNLNWIKVWSLLLWLDPEVNLWDWSQGLQLFHLSLVVKEHRIWPIIYWEMHHWWWFLSFWIIFLENNWLLLLSEQVWKWEVYRWHTHNHKRFI